MGFKWTPTSEARLREMWKRELPTAQIAATLGITATAVISKAYRMHLPSKWKEGLSRREAPGPEHEMDTSRDWEEASREACEGYTHAILLHHPGSRYLDVSVRAASARRAPVGGAGDHPIYA